MPFTALRPFPKLNQADYEKKKDRINRLVKLNKFEEATAAAEELYELAMEGVGYYQRYYR